MTFEEKIDIDGKEDDIKELTSTAPKDEEQGFYIGSIFFSSKEECLDTTTPTINVVKGSKDIEQPLTSSSGEKENISNNSLTEVETTYVAGEEAEIVFNNESTETETGLSETEIIEPDSNDDAGVVETGVPDHSGEKAQPSAVGRQDGVAYPSSDVTDQHKTVSTGAKKPSSWVDEVESASDVELSEIVSPADELTKVDEALNTRVEHVCHVGEVRGVSTTLRSNWRNKSNLTFNRVVENIPRQHQPIVRQRENDDKIGEQIGFALLQLDEMNRKKDVVRMEVESRKITSKEYRDKYEAAKSEQNIAYDVLNAKRQELDSVQSTLNMIKNAVLVKQTADKVCNMHHRLEHETIYSIQEEKRLLRELKQLEASHRELLSIIERQTKPQPSFDEKEPLEKRFKALKEELDSAKKELSRIKPITNAAGKMYFDENRKLNEMQGQFKAANVFCQEAYANIQNFKRQLYKNKYYQMYKDDDFRNKYLKSNPMSTLALAVAKRKVEDDKVVTLSTSTEKPEMITEDNKHIQEEEELPREDEVLLPKEKVVVKSREEIVAEEKAKAKEAEERKKRSAEKAKARVELMEQKEAERKQKVKAKKDRKKARKKAQKGIVDGESLVPSTDQDSSLQLITKEQEEPEISEKPIVQELLGTKEKPRSKKSKRSSISAKTNAVVSPPLPNKNKAIQLWKWVILSAVAVSVVCLPGLHHFLL